MPLELIPTKTITVDFSETGLAVLHFSQTLEKIIKENPEKKAFDQEPQFVEYANTLLKCLFLFRKAYKEKCQSIPAKEKGILNQFKENTVIEIISVLEQLFKFVALYQKYNIETSARLIEQLVHLMYKMPTDLALTEATKIPLERKQRFEKLKISVVSIWTVLFIEQNSGAIKEFLTAEAHLEKMRNMLDECQFSEISKKESFQGIRQICVLLQARLRMEQGYLEESLKNYQDYLKLIENKRSPQKVEKEFLQQLNVTFDYCCVLSNAFFKEGETKKSIYLLEEAKKHGIFLEKNKFKRFKQNNNWLNLEKILVEYQTQEIKKLEAILIKNDQQSCIQIKDNQIVIASEKISPNLLKKIRKNFEAILKKPAYFVSEKEFEALLMDLQTIPVIDNSLKKIEPPLPISLPSDQLNVTKKEVLDSSESNNNNNAVFFPSGNLNPTSSKVKCYIPKGNREELRAKIQTPIISIPSPDPMNKPPLFSEKYANEKIFPLWNDHIPKGIYFGFFAPKDPLPAEKEEIIKHARIVEEGRIVPLKGKKGIVFTKKNSEIVLKTKDPVSDPRCYATPVEQNKNQVLFCFENFRKHGK